MEVAVPMIEETQALYPDLRMCSFDRGYRNNRIRHAVNPIETIRT